MDSQQPGYPPLHHRDERQPVGSPRPEDIECERLQSFGDDGSDEGQAGQAVNDNHETPAIVCYQPETDEVKMFSKPLTNQDGAEINLYYIRCIKEDLEHNLWIGTDQGPFYITSHILDDTQPTLTQVKVPRADSSLHGSQQQAAVEQHRIARHQ